MISKIASSGYLRVEIVFIGTRVEAAAIRMRLLEGSGHLSSKCSVHRMRENYPVSNIVTLAACKFSLILMLIYIRVCVHYLNTTSYIGLTS